MRILIAGAGTIGSNLAISLAKEGQDVVVVDSDEERLAALASADCQTRVGDATSPLLLEAVGIRRTDLVVAVTRSDAVNLLVCSLAAFYKVPRRLARVRAPEFTDSDCPVPSDALGADHFISPEAITVSQIERLVRSPGTVDAVDFENGRICLRAVTISEDCEIAGSPLAQVHASVQGGFLIAAIRRGGRTVLPGGDEKLRLGDVVYLATTREMLPTVLPVFAPYARPARHAIVFGASITGVEAARRLKRFVDRVTLIEPDERCAREVAERLDPVGVEVLCGSALDEALLGRCHVDHADCFLAVSGDDADNFMAALLFRRFSDGVPIVLTSQPHYVDILESAGLEVVLNPRLLAVSSLLRHIRGGSVMSVARLRSEESEFLELRPGRRSPVVGKPLRGLGIRARGVLVVAVLRGDEVMIPRGDTVIAEGDRVLVFAQGGGVRAAGALFA